MIEFKPENHYSVFQKESIGQKFTTRFDNTLTIKGVVKRNKICKNEKFVLECSVCSKDEELWPYGSITSTKYSLTNGVIPCGCGRSPRWTEGQFLVRINRLCNDNGFLFMGWDGDFIGSHTKLIIRNLENNNVWRTSTINSLLNNCIDPTDRYNKSSKTQLLSENEWLKRFSKYKLYRDDLSFKGFVLENKNHFISVICPDCSNDEYVQAGVCNGEFKTNVRSLIVGYIPCRCSTTYRWTQEQREYQIKNILHTEGGSFIRWSHKDGYKKSDCKFIWRCKNGHTVKTSTANFINHKQRCRYCLASTNMNGYYPSKKNCKDYLYIITNKEWFKCGRSFKPKTRVSDINNVSGVKSKYLLILSGNHDTVYRVEQKIKKLMYKANLQYFKENGWRGSTECYKIKALRYVLQYLSTEELLEIDYSYMGWVASNFTWKDDDPEQVELREWFGEKFKLEDI